MKSKGHRKKSRHLPLDKLININLLAGLIGIGFIVALMRVSFSQAEDMGIWLSVQGLVSKGYSLYSQVYDNKDPLFHYINAFSVSLFGYRGPFLIDAFCVIVSGPLAYLTARELKIKNSFAIVGALVFLLTLTGFNYNALRTQIHAIVLIFLVIILCLKKEFLKAGVISACCVLFKMPISLFLFVILPFIFIGNISKNLASYIKGLSVFFFIFFALMHLRGEFFPYLEVVKDNFRYQDSYQSLVGQQNGIEGHIQVWNSYNKSFFGYITICICMLIIYVLRRRNFSKETTMTFKLAACLNLSTFLFLLSSAMWPHHLQILAISATFNIWVFLQALSYIPWGKDLRFLDFISTTLLSIVGISLVIACSGTRLSMSPAMNLQQWITPQWVKPAELRMLDEVQLPAGSPSTVSRLGSGDDGGWGLFLDESWKFSCIRLSIEGKETLPQVRDFVNCLSEVPSVILVSPAYLGLKERAGSYPYFLAATQEVLRQKFTCRQFDQSYSVCVRKPVRTDYS